MKNATVPPPLTERHPWLRHCNLIKRPKSGNNSISGTRAHETKLECENKIFKEKTIQI